MRMPEETMYEGVKQETRGLKDPGNILIAVYILLVLLLLLFTGLESAKADFSKAKEGTFLIERKGDVSLPAWTTRLDHSHFVNKGLSEK
jgi:hypothetical protein